MKKYLLLTLCALLSLSQGVLAQSQMHVNMKNGSVMNVFVSEIESITWDAPTDDPGENNPDDPTVTGDALNVTGNSATIVSYANGVRDNESTDLKIGIIYCTEGTPNKSNGTQKTVTKSQVAADGRYTINLTGLGPGTTYYFRSFVYQSGLWFYGKVRSFTTTAQNITANFQTYAATNVTCFSAKVSANLQLVSSLSYGSMTYGICYGKDAEPTERLKASGKDGAGNYSVTLRALEGNTIYYYRPYAEVDGTTYYGQTSSFKTLEDNVVVTGDADADLNVRSRLTIGGGSYSQLEVGLCWSSTNELPTVADMAVSTNELDDENCFEVKITSYGNIHYRAYVKIDGVAHYGAVKSVENKMHVGEAVDLGLSVKWANCNVGAEKPEEYGDYFAWGETGPKSNYSWSTYFDSVNGSSSNFTKYATDKKTQLDPEDDAAKKTQLDPEDDAAHVNWGGDWRMPTRAEQDELRTKCIWTWTTQNGVKGYKVSSKVNSNSIFLPAAGYRLGSSLGSAGYGGDYWSSSLGSSYSGEAYDLSFSSSDVYWNSHNRYFGRSVRAVCP